MASSADLEPPGIDRTTAAELVADSPLVKVLLEAVGGYLMILDSDQRILAANRQLLEEHELEDPACLIGDRVGDVLDCVLVKEGSKGCGAAIACATCGVTVAARATQTSGRTTVAECSLTLRRRGHLEAVEFRVRSTPLRLGPHELTTLLLQDISAEKRRDALERIFFHDILNTLGGLRGWARLFDVVNQETAAEAARRIVVLSERLGREIEGHRLLVQAEAGALALELTAIRPREILDAVASVFAPSNGAAGGERLEVAPTDEQQPFVSDSCLVVRILTNMVLNALEASASAKTPVKLWYDQAAGPAFYVHNHGAIPGEVARHIFERSFSTKADKGRGLGTWGMKLLGERYLGGTVAFTSSEQHGTTFMLALREGASRRE